MVDVPLQTQVAALYVHGDRTGRLEDTEPVPMLAMERVEAVKGRGIRQDWRFFRPADIGRDRKRQVSLIDTGTIARLEARFGPIEWRLIKSQIVLTGDIRLPDYVGWTLTFDEGPVLEIAIYRDPCFKMDLIKPGLREAMDHGEQGALARVLTDGEVRVGQRVSLQPAVVTV